MLDLVTDRDEPAREPADLVVRLGRGDFQIGMGAVPQADAHGDGADVEIFHLHHADGLDDLVRGKLHRHEGALRSGA